MPIATVLTALACAATPNAKEFSAVDFALAAIATESSPLDSESIPIAIEFEPDAVALAEIAVALIFMALAETPKA